MTWIDDAAAEIGDLWCYSRPMSLESVAAIIARHYERHQAEQLKVEVREFIAKIGGDK